MKFDKDINIRAEDYNSDLARPTKILNRQKLKNQFRCIFNQLFLFLTFDFVETLHATSLLTYFTSSFYAWCKISVLVVAKK